ncbi:caprin family member 2 [Chelydra serpentina]|uniref:Caprin-2 n=1 Tax=Chelydra serpentina TaxID=8475 RepID=A0A8T1TEG8_CHESE|nr:caprin family member 2 [Chelydra serpentina]
MVQLSQSPFRCPSPSGHSEGGEDKSMKPAKQQVTPSQPGENQPPLSPLQAALNSAASPSQAYETYIDNGLICLKHKIRNIEKKKLKLEDYRDRLKKGEALNQDQLEAVEKYDEVMHNLEFAKELQKTFSGLSQDLLKAQRKAQRRETIMKLEAEKKKLRTILQVQYVLQNFTQEHVQKDFKGGLNGAIYLPSKELDYLIRFAKLTCPERNESLSVEDQMEQSSLYFWDLLEGSEKAVVGTTYKHMKELLSKLLNSGYFENIPVPRNMQIKEELEEEVMRKSERAKQLPKESVKEPEPLMKLLQSEIQPQEFLNRRYLPEAECSIKKPEERKPWEAEYTRKQEPPKSWEMLVDIEEQEQKKQKQESLKPWESCGRHQEQKKQESPKLWEACVCEEEGQKQESSKPWETSVREEEQKKQETPKPWVMHVREEQDSPKPWIKKVREEQEQRKQPSPRLWATKVQEEPDQKQESPRPWVTQTREEPEQKKQEPVKPWAMRGREEPEQKKQEPMKPWVTQTREEPEQKKQEPVKPWAMRVREEPEQKKQEPVKSWETRVREESEHKKQDPPKAWETSDRQQPVSQQLQNTPKSWGAASLVPKEQIAPKKCDVEPKDDGKTDGLSGGHHFDAVRKKEVLQSVGESFKLPRSLQSNVQVPKPGHQSAAEFCSTSTLPKDPILRREKLQDLMTQIQGTYNFMQESILDVDKASPSAICSSQPPSRTPTGSPVASKEQKLPSQKDFLQQPPQAAASPMTLHGSNTSLTSADHTLSGSETDDLMTPQTPQTSEPLSQETENYTSSQPPYQTSPCISEPVISKKIEIAQATIPLPREPQSPLPTSSTSMSPVSQGQTFQSPPASSSSVTINAAPFQAMQTVFKVNAPLPPRKEQEIKDDTSYSAGYNQSFSTASTQTPPQCQLQSTHVAEQNSLSQETLPTVNYQPDGAVPVSNGSLAFYPAQTVFTRPTQPYLNSRGSVRGSARGGRSLTNSYRSPGGYKGFDAYRGSPSIPNGNYGQLQFASRDYPGIPYSQRDVNYQQCYKRGGVTGGPRSNSRAGWSDSSQVSSPERDNETFNSGDSGQGDSRSITPVDMPVTSQAATILPVHVYPLPHQMRVAFSAARTSNLAPGTLDQPIAFDLLLNNLGETFDIQLGRFNCPVNGTYVFIFHMLKLAVNVPLYVNLMKNEEVLVSAYANDGAPDHETASNHAVLQLFQGDQIWLRLHRGAIYGSSWKYSTFSGYLLYQD